MTTPRRSVFMTAVVLVSALAGAAAVAGPAAALDSSTAAPFPHSPGTTVDTFPVSVIAKQNDAITGNGMKSMTLDYGASKGFDGNVRNVTTSDVSVFITGNSGFRRVNSVAVSTKSNGRVRLTFQNPVQVRPGDRITARVGNVTTPSAEGDYSIGVSTTAVNGVTDGPVSVNYNVVAAALGFSNQSASQFSAHQTVTITGVLPNTGYVAVFTRNQNGSPGTLVGHTKPTIATYHQRNYSVPLDGHVNQSQPLVAVAYYETSGDTQSERLNQSFDPNEDTPVTNNGVLANATGYVTTVDADGRLTAGDQYDQGARLYFAEGDPSTSYRLDTADNGSVGQTVQQFETGQNGTATINTSGLKKGQYVVTRIDNGEVVGLDNDSTTSAQDDSFFITGKTLSQNQNTTTAGNNTTSSRGTTTESGGANGTASANVTTSAGTNGGNGGASANENGSGGASGAGGNNGGGNNSNSGGGESGSGNGGSGAFGPGFGITVAVVALLGAALLAVRRAR